MARLGVHVDKQGVALLPAAAHDVLKGGNELQGVKFNSDVMQEVVRDRGLLLF